MAPPDIPADILAFLTERIDTVPELEALLMMREQADRVWTVPDVAARIYTTLPAAAAVLEALQRRGLVAREAAGDYRFRPHSAADAALVTRVGDFYRANVVLVATTIHAKASASVREFARAFEFKKDS